MVSLVESYHVYEMNLYDGQEEQQKEHEEEMRARLRRSESIEKAAVSVLSSLSYLKRKNFTASGYVVNDTFLCPLGGSSPRFPAFHEPTGVFQATVAKLHQPCIPTHR